MSEEIVVSELSGLTFTIAALREAYLGGGVDLHDVFAEVRARIRRHADNPVWICVVDDVTLAREFDRVRLLDRQTHPLWGIPFAVKDNIDVGGLPTTAACAAFTRMAHADAPVVAALRAAGAIVVGKTNLDQFATGLVGTRSPYGEVKNAFLPDYISGGSSSGSAVALALGQVAFAFGTDTAGSGRVPAALNGLVGLKPTRGLLSTRGVVPACRSLDCVSLFTRDLDDAATVFSLLRTQDLLDPYSRAMTLDASIPAGLRIGVPRAVQREFFGDAESAALYDAALARAQAAGAVLVEIDLAPFSEAARLLYAGPWVAERYHVVQRLLEAQPDTLLPVTRQIIAGGAGLTAEETFAALYRLQALRRQAEPLLASVDAILTPTIPRPCTRAEVAAEPVLRNSELGHYTNFMNLLDLAALALPQGSYANGLPHGVTLFADRGSDLKLLALAARLFPETVAAATGTAAAGTTPDNTALKPLVLQDDVRRLDILVCGAHMSCLPLNIQLTERGAVFREAVQTAACYRFWALPGGPPFRPAMLRVAPGETGGSIAAEIWSLPAARWGDFVQLIPAPLGIGTVELADGRKVKGFIGEGCAAAGAEDITALGGWREFLARKAQV